MFALSIRQEQTERLSNLVVGTFLATTHINETKEGLSTAETASELIYILTLGKLMVSIGSILWIRLSEGRIATYVGIGHDSTRM